jgi:hypothetical protein
MSDEKLDEVLSKLSGMARDMDVLLQDGQRTNIRLTRVEERLDDFDGRLMRNSSRVKDVSENDLTHEAKLADVIVWREKVDAELQETKALIVDNNAMTARIERAATDVLSSPRVKALSWALWLALAGWLASKGIRVGQ